MANDFNSELINIYKVIKEKPNDLILALEKHERLNSEEYFYEIRALDRNENYEEINDIEKAAKIITVLKKARPIITRSEHSGLSKRRLITALFRQSKRRNW